MATKSLARSVIEGGRSFYNSFERRDSHRAVRAFARDRLLEARLEPEGVDDTFFAPPQRVRRVFHDELGPAYRFLDSRVGRPWDETRSLLVQRFDARTTAGRHVLFDHLFREIAHEESAPDARWSRYWVDVHGRLQRKERRRHRPHFVPRPPLEWLGRRKLGRIGSLLAWFVPTRDADRVAVIWTGRALEYVLPTGTLVGFRQARALDARERAFFEALAPAVQTVLLATSPVRARQTRA